MQSLWKESSALHVENFQLFKPNNPGSLVPKNKVNLTTRSSHDGNNQRDAEVPMSCFINSTDTVVLHSILPVRIRQKGHETPVETYALYDNGISGCFITNELGLSYSKTEVIHDLVVSDYDDQFPIELPTVFTKSEIPANHDQIPKSDVIQDWPHLHQIAKKIPIYHPKLDIGLLIGSNCPKTLQPLKVKFTKQPFSSEPEVRLHDITPFFHYGFTKGPLSFKKNPSINKATSFYDSTSSITIHTRGNYFNLGIPIANSYIYEGVRIIMVLFVIWTK